MPRGRPSVPVGTIVPCSTCGKPHEKKPKRMACDDCLKAEAAFWSRIKHEERKAKAESGGSVPSMRAALDNDMSMRMLRVSLKKVNQ